MNAKLIFGLINLVFIVVYFNYFPSFISNISDAYSYYDSMASQINQIENWQHNKNSLNMKKLSLEAQINQMSLDIPSYDNPADLIKVINDHAQHYKIRNMSHLYGKYRTTGNYMFRNVVLEFDADYLNGIRFLNQLENDRHLITLKNVEIMNEKNRKARPIHFTVSIELVLKKS